MNDSPDGQTYSERYKVFDYPHLAIIDPRTGRSLWKKEGWTQEKPFSAADFAEMAMDFCSRHSFDKAPLAPSKKTANGATGATPNGKYSGERKRPFMSEEEQLQAAMVASLKRDEAHDNIDVDGDEDEYVMDEDDDDIQYLGTAEEMAQKSEDEEEEKQPSFIDNLLATEVGDEPPVGARIQLRMPDATRMVRKFAKSNIVKTIYAFVAVSYVFVLSSSVPFSTHSLLFFSATVCDISKTTRRQKVERSSYSWQVFRRRISNQIWTTPSSLVGSTGRPLQ